MNSYINIIKFISALLIMAFHIPHIGADFTHIHFMSAHRYVELFAIITGFYTTKHFVNKETNIYIFVYRKVAKLFPYILISVSVEWLIQIFNKAIVLNSIQDFFILFIDYVLEVFCLSGFAGTSIRLSTLWYMAALVQAIPIFILCIKSNSNFVKAVIYFYSILWFSYLNTLSIPLYDTQRVLSCLFVGYFAYNLSVLLTKKNIKMYSLGMIFYSLTIFYAYINVDRLRLVVLFYFISCVLISVHKGSDNKVVRGLGDMSMVIYLVHWPIGSLLYYYSDLVYFPKILLYYFLTIVVSATLLIGINAIKIKCKHINEIIFKK